jgi:hypothetical protein
MKFTTKSLALSLTLFIALAPAAAFAQNEIPYAPTSAHKRLVHRHVRTAPGQARLARPTVGQAPQQSPPAISRDPNDCVKTMCTCLGGGGC